MSTEISGPPSQVQFGALRSPEVLRDRAAGVTLGSRGGPRGGVMARMAAACDVLLAGFGRAMRYARLAFHAGPDDRLTRAPGGRTLPT
jgi:hypothetical protein